MKFLFSFFILLAISWFLPISLTCSGQVIDKKDADIKRVYSQQDTSRVEELLRQSNEKKSYDIKKALELAKQSLEIAEKINYKNGKAKSHYQLSTIYLILQENKLAESSLKNASSLFKDLNNSHWQLKCVFNEAYLNKNIKNFPKAISIYSGLSNNKTVTRDSFFLTGVYTNLGNIYHNIGVLDSAYFFYNKALTINEKKRNNEGIASSLIALAAVQDALKEYDQAIIYSRRTLPLWPKNDVRIANTYYNIGLAYYNLSKYDSSLHYLKKSLIIYDKYGDILNSVDVKFTIGNSYFEAGNFDEAQKYYSQALSASENTSSTVQKGYAYYVLSHLNYRKNNNIQLAKTYLDSSIRIFNEINQTLLLVDAYLLMGEIDQKLGNYKKSSEYYRYALDLKDSVFSEGKRDLILSLDRKYETERKNATISRLFREKEIFDLKLERKNLQLYSMLTLLIIILLLLVIGVLFYKINLSRNKQRQLELEQRLFLSQLNPHFIFNALSSIQNFVLTNKAKDATIYLSDFSRLMRMVLESSRQKSISIEDEISFLNKYLSLQQMMYDFSFNYKIDANEEDLKAFEIPPMLLQPFIENSIKHGFSSANYKGEINIYFIKQKSNLNIEIIDNGIGINNSKGQNENKNHNSLGTTISEERIKNMNKTRSKKIIINIADRSESNNPTSGTIVKIVIPTEHE